jgi:CPA1 family monovalent cation:H+ antiporter
MSIDDHALELLITLALVMSTYAAALNLHLSGPIAVVVAGLWIGNPGRQLAMSPRTREHVDAFWSVLDEILNTVLFLLLGLEVFAIATGAQAMIAGTISIVVVLVARLISVALPVTMLSLGRVSRGLVPVLTWSGLRGGLSVAMALSLPSFPGRELLISCTYAVVVFSILIQGTTVRRVLVHYGVGADPRSS